MSETKEEIAADRDRLLAENENLRGQLAAAGAARPGTAAPAQHRFLLSEGQRQDLEMHGNTEIGGRFVDTGEVRGMLEDDQQRIEIDTPDTVRQVPQASTRTKIPGVDFVYPSVEYGKLDPAVADAPGVHGPAV